MESKQVEVYEMPIEFKRLLVRANEKTIEINNLYEKDKEIMQHIKKLKDSRSEVNKDIMNQVQGNNFPLRMIVPHGGENYEFTINGTNSVCVEKYTQVFVK